MVSSIWVEKYRPTNLNELILNERNKNIVGKIINNKMIPNMTLYSPTNGIGKTSIAKMLGKLFCEEDEVLFINGSLNRNIDTIRNEMTDFMYRDTISGNKKIIIIDEADGINRIAQDSLRNFIETWQEDCSFILTCNDVTKIIPAIISRCPKLDLSVLPTDRKIIAKQIYDKCVHILRDNLIEYDDEALKYIITNYFPDIRQTINVLQRLSLSGKITVDLVKGQEISKNQSCLSELEIYIVDKDWAKLRSWAHDNYNIQSIYQHIYDDLITKIDKECVSDFIIITGEYSYRSNSSPYPEINLASYLAEVCSKVKINV